LLERGTLRVINPATSVLLQNKATQAVIWELAQHGGWFNAIESETIKRVFLPTFLDQPPDDGVYVRKPVFGREGSSIAVVRGAHVLAQSPGRKYLNSRWCIKILSNSPRSAAEKRSQHAL
jgi:glutathionylspermidine synthase